MASKSHESPRVLRRRQLEAALGVSRSWIYDRMADGDFPRPISLGGRTVGWIAAEVESWLAGQIMKSRRGE